MRRSIEPNPPAGVAVRCLEEGADGTLSIGAGHVNEAEAMLRMPAACGQFEGGFEAGLKAEDLKATQKADGFRVGHRSGRIEIGAEGKGEPTMRGRIRQLLTYF